MSMKFKHIIALSLMFLCGMPVSAQTDDASVQENPVIIYSGRAARYEIADIIVT